MGRHVFKVEGKDCIIESNQGNILQDFYFSSDLYPMWKFKDGKVITTFGICNEPKYCMSIVEVSNEKKIDKIYFYKIIYVEYFVNVIYMRVIGELKFEEAYKIFERCKRETKENIDNIRNLRCRANKKETISMEDLIYAYVLSYFNQYK